MERRGENAFTRREHRAMISCLRAVSCAVVTFAAIAATAQALPFELVDNRVFVDVAIDGKGPYKFILDTGAIATVSDAAVRELNLKVKDAGEGTGVGEKAVRNGRTHVSELKLGGVTLHDLDLGVLSFDDAPAVFGSKPVHGIIGLPIFERSIVTFDYVKRQVTLNDPNKYTVPSGATVVPFQRRGHIPVVDGQLDGISGRFAIDTGARSALLLYGPFTDKNNLGEKYHATVAGITGWGIGGPVRSFLARAATFKLGPAEVHNIVIRLSTQRSGATTASDIAGLIGPDILKQFTVTFDYPRSRILLVRNSNYGQRDSWDRTGMWMAADSAAATEWRVLDVMANSPAAQAGIRVDDQIVKVDNKSVSQLLLPDVRDSFRARPVGSKLKIEYRRGSQVHGTELTLRDIV
jgi:Aspartyl protease/PDZ domain